MPYQAYIEGVITDQRFRAQQREATLPREVLPLPPKLENIPKRKKIAHKTSQKKKFVLIHEIRGQIKLLNPPTQKKYSENLCVFM
jgi:hypothetical protein